MKEPSVSLYIDYQNVRLTQLEINNLLNYARAKGSLARKKVYYNSQCPDQSSVQKLFANYDLDCIDVPCPLKNSSDNQLLADCIQDALVLSPNVFIVVSGDGDFLSLVRILQKLNNQVLIVGRKGNVKQKLIESANEFCFIDQLPELLCLDPCDSSRITYEEAIQCLIEAINAATASGRSPQFSAIDQLMRKSQKFPGYRGVTSIWRRNGKKFTCFKQFAESVAKDGLVCIKTRGRSQEFQLLQTNLLAA